MFDRSPPALSDYETIKSLRLGRHQRSPIHPMPTMLPTRVDINGDRRPEMIRAFVVVATLSTIAVIARLASRRLKQIPLGASDYTIICAFLLCWATNIAGFLQVHFGEGRHIEVVPSANVIKIIQVGKDPRLKAFKWTLKLFPDHVCL